MSGYIVLPRARADLREIWSYTAGEWGMAQADRYIRDIEMLFQAVAEHSKRGRACDEIRAGYSRISVGSHVVFYRATRAKISIVRVLHQRMDFPRRL